MPSRSASGRRSPPPAPRRRVFGVYLSPLPTQVTIFVSIVGAGLPVAVSYGAMGLEFSVGAVRRRRRGATGAQPRRYLAGAGEPDASATSSLAEPPTATAAVARDAPRRAESCCGTSEPRRAASALPEAGELCAVEALDREGLLVTSEGALVRFLRVDAEEPARDVRGRARAGRPRVRTARRPPAGRAVAAVLRRGHPGPARRAARAQPGRGRARDPGARAATATGGPAALRRLHAALRESLERHADEQAAVDVAYYVVVPYLPDQRPRVDWRALLPRRPSAGWARAALGAVAGVASAGGARVAAPDRLDPRRPRGARPLHPPARPARRCSTCCGGASTRPPPIARRSAARARASSGSRSSASSTPSPTRARRRAAAHALRELVAALGDRLAPTSATCASTATSSRRSTSPRCRTRPSSAGCWTRCRSSAPFTLSVHVHALDRLRERSRFKARHRRLFGVNRGAELRGRTPDYEMLAQEEELGELLKELSGHERSAAFEVSIYQSIRERGPDPDPVAARRGRRAGLAARSSPPPTRA